MEPRWKTWFPRRPPEILRLAALAQLCLVLSFLVRLWLNRGGFWRDELCGILLAQAPSLADLLARLERDSAPPLFTGLLHGWIMLGPGRSEAGMAAFGYLCFLGLFGALWWHSQRLHRQAPLAGLALLAFSPLVFYWGSSVRSYALAGALIILLFSAVWRFLEAPGWRTYAWMMLAAVLGAQANYQNCPLIFGVCVAGCLVAWRRNAFRYGVLILSAGAWAALSLLPYLTVIARAGQWLKLFEGTARAGGAAGAGFEALSWGQPQLAWLWLLAMASVMAAGIARQVSRWPMSPATGTEAPYAALALFLATAATLAQSTVLGSESHPWYFLPWMALTAACVETAAVTFATCRLGRLFPGLFCLAVFVVSFQPLMVFSGIRRTTMDQAAHVVAAAASPRDLVVVNPAWYASGFEFYNHGTCPWVVVPGITGADIQAADGAHMLFLVSHKQQAARLLETPLRECLARGGTVWIVGYLHCLPPDAPDPAPPAAWAIGPNTTYWSAVLGRYLRRHADSITEVPLPGIDPEMVFERIGVTAVTGWHD